MGLMDFLGQSDIEKLKSEIDEMRKLYEQLRQEDLEKENKLKELKDKLDINTSGNELISGSIQEFESLKKEYEKKFIELEKREKEIAEKEVGIEKLQEQLKLQQTSTDQESSIEMQSEESTADTPSVEANDTFAKYEAIEATIKDLRGLIKNIDYKDNINKELHEELQLYKNGLKKEFVLPIVKQMIQWYDTIVDLHRYYKSSYEKEDTQHPLLEKLLEQFINLSYSVLDCMYMYDVEPFDVTLGEEYSPKIHKVIDVKETSDPLLAKKIISCEKQGFKDTSTDRLVRLAEVTIYKFQN